MYIYLCFNSGVEGLSVWDKPVGGRHVQTGSLKKEGKEATPEKNHKTLTTKNQQRLAQHLQSTGVIYIKTEKLKEKATSERNQKTLTMK